MKDFREEYKAFLNEFPFSTVEVNGMRVRYQYGGKDGAPVLLFFHGLEMQEMWMPYAQYFKDACRFLIYEYPKHTAKADEQVDFVKVVLQKLQIESVMLIGASDGGVYAQIFAQRHPDMVSGMILMTTLTLDSDHCRDIKKEKFIMPLVTALLKMIPARTEMRLLLKKSDGFLDCESAECRKYGKTFYETVASDLHYKDRFIHSMKCVYMLKDIPVFRKKDFEYLRGRIQILVPESDIFKEEDQQRLIDLFEGVDAEILDAPGGHVGFIVQSEAYIEKIDAFLRKCS